MSRRTERIAAQLREEIARVLLEEVTDPRTRLVTLTRVDVAPDLSNALIYWSALEVKDRRAEDVQAGLESAAKFIRRSISKVLPLRRTPELRFSHDPSLELGSETLSILRELEDGQRK